MFFYVFFYECRRMKKLIFERIFCVLKAMMITKAWENETYVEVLSVFLSSSVLTRYGSDVGSGQGTADGYHIDHWITLPSSILAFYCQLIPICLWFPSLWLNLMVWGQTLNWTIMIFILPTQLNIWNRINLNLIDIETFFLLLLVGICPYYSSY